MDCIVVFSSYTRIRSKEQRSKGATAAGGGPKGATEAKQRSSRRRRQKAKEQAAEGSRAKEQPPNAAKSKDTQKPFTEILIAFCVLPLLLFHRILVYGSKEQRPPEAVPKPKGHAGGGGEDDRSKPPKAEQTEATRQGSKPLD